MNTWLLRASASDKNCITDFINNGVVGIAWPQTGDLTGKSQDEIKKIVAKSYSLSGIALGSAYANLNTFVNKFKVGDILLVPVSEKIFFAKIISEYKYIPDQQDYPHQREVEWLNNSRSILRESLTSELRSSLRVPKTIANLSHHYNTILALATGEKIIENFIEVEYQLRLDVKAKVNIPNNITKSEASRLADFVKTLYFENE